VKIQVSQVLCTPVATLIADNQDRICKKVRRDRDFKVGHDLKRQADNWHSVVPEVVAETLIMPLDRILQTLQHLQTPFISTFLLIHLAAPISSNVGSSNSASQVMVSFISTQSESVLSKKSVPFTIVK
jgi:hypothetical protein